jgi:hypothetical protein
MLADPKTYLAPLSEELTKTWPKNRLVNIVCHGHSVPAGYFKTPVVDSFHAYPHLVELRQHAVQERALAETFELGLADSFARWERASAEGTLREALLSQSNHPNEAGHTLVVEELLRWFPAPRGV